MPRKFLETIDDGDLVDDVYLEDDGTYFHDIHYKDDEPDPDDTGEYYTDTMRAYPEKDY